MPMMNETYIRVFSCAATAVLQEMIRRGGSVEQVTEEAVRISLEFSDRAIESDALGMQDGTAVRLQVAAQLAAALVPTMPHHTPHDIAGRALQLADALLDMVEGK